MAWSKFHSIPFVNDNTFGTFHTYLFNTALPAKGWTVSNHPSGNAFKRSISYTLTDWHSNQNTTMRFWVDWYNAISSNWVLYPDKTFTTTPGDLGTALYGGVTFYDYVANPYAPDSFSFWGTTSKTNALLVTRGKKVIFFWPGMTSFAGYRTDSELNKTYIYPFTSNGIRVGGSPLTTGTSSQMGYVYPMVNQGSASYFVSDPNRLYSNFPVVGGMQGYPYQDSFLLYFENNPDVTFYVPSSSTTNDWYGSSGYSTYGSLVFDGTNYHLACQSDMAKPSYWFNLGTTEPVF